MQGGFEDWSLGRLLSTAARHVEREWNQLLARHDLTHSGLLVLQALGGGPKTQRELAAASQVEEQTMARVVGRLERTGHVSRERDDHDRRRMLVRRTRLGTEAFRELGDPALVDAIVLSALADPAAFRTELVSLIRSSRGADEDSEPSSG